MPSGQFSEYDYMVNDFNSLNNGYKVKLVDYSSYFDTQYADESGAVMSDEAFIQVDNQIALDIIKGDKLNIIPSGVFADCGKYEQLEHKGAFINLYPLMNKDSEINTDTLYDHVLQLHEIDGCLYSLPTYFEVGTMIGETRFVGEKENWTLDELIEHWEQAPENASFNGSFSRDYVYMCILRATVSSFVDKSGRTAHFDSLEFLKILNFCNSFPESEDKASELHSDVSFVEPMTFRGFYDLHYNLWNRDNEPYTFVGYPSENGCGSYINTKTSRFAICADSSPEEIQGAWEFLKYMASYEYQSENITNLFPINLRAFEESKSKAITESEDTRNISIQGTEYDIGVLTQEETDRISQYIDNTKVLSNVVDTDISNIIEEEIFSMFHGESTPEEAAQMIQNRVSVLTAERY